MSAPESEPAGGTLLALVRAAESGPRSLQSVRFRIRRTHQLTASYLGLGFLTVAVLMIVRGGFSYFWALDAGSSGPLTGAAWAVVVAAFVAGAVTALLRRGELPSRALLLVLAVDAAALVLEIVDSALPGSAGVYYPSVCVGVGATLLGLMPFHPLRRTYTALGLLALLSTATLLVQSGGTPGGLGIGTTIILLALVPTAFCAVILTTVDDHVHRRLDRTITESTIDGPGTGPGSLAASELSRVDARVEELLAEITQEAPAALDEETADRARVLGDALRDALARSHDRTWLRIAVDESAHLSEAVALSDPAGLAARLRPPDRARLLSVLWLLTEGASSAGRGVSTVFAPGEAAPAGPAPIAISVIVLGRRPRDLDPAVWGILGELGAHRVRSDGSGTTVRLEHALESPGDTRRTP